MNLSGALQASEFFRRDRWRRLSTQPFQPFLIRILIARRCGRRWRRRCG
jgi:hypothetical protein